MPILTEVATYLAANSTLAVGGVTGTLQITQMTDDMANTVVALYETGGSATVKAFSTGAGAARVYEQPGLQALSRSTSYATARASAGIVYDLLDGISNTTMTGVTYLSVDAVQPPFAIGRDDNERHLISVNFQVKKATT